MAEQTPALQGPARRRAPVVGLAFAPRRRGSGDRQAGATFIIAWEGRPLRIRGQIRPGATVQGVCSRTQGRKTLGRRRDRHRGRDARARRMLYDARCTSLQPPRPSAASRKKVCLGQPCTCCLLAPRGSGGWCVRRVHSRPGRAPKPLASRVAGPVPHQAMARPGLAETAQRFCATRAKAIDSNP